MIKNKKHIIFLALLQLVVFIAPLTIKDFHSHIYLQSDNNNNTSIHKIEKPCAICNFEFVQVVTKTPFEIHHYISVISKVISYSNNQYYKIPYSSYNLRGPPEF